MLNQYKKKKEKKKKEQIRLRENFRSSAAIINMTKQELI